jgi:hypothetical protein
MLARRAAQLGPAALIRLLVARMPARSGGLPAAAGLAWSAFAFQGNIAPLWPHQRRWRRGMQARDDIVCSGGLHASFAGRSDANILARLSIRLRAAIARSRREHHKNESCRLGAFIPPCAGGPSGR